MIDYAEFLKQYRIEKGLTLREVSEITGLTPQHLSRIEHGKVSEIHPKTICKLNKLLEESEEQ